MMTNINPRLDTKNSAPPADFQKEADRITLSHYAPPGVLIDENYNIVQFRGWTGRYLAQPPGEPTTNALKMARDGLFVELRKALLEAKAHGEAVYRKQIRLRAEDGVQEIDFNVHPVKSAETDKAYFLILFEDRIPPASAGISSDDKLTPMKRVSHEAMDQEQELWRLRQELLAVHAKPRESADEEFILVNGNTPLCKKEPQNRSELKTGKEEFQLAKETAPQNDTERDRTTNDLSNLLTSTTLPLAMVDDTLRVRRVTASAAEVMNISLADVGRPIGEIKINLDLPDLEQLIKEVLDKAQIQEREVRHRDGHWYMLRVTPYRTAADRVGGAVIMLVDIDLMRRGLEELSHQAEMLRCQVSLLDLSRDAIIVCNEHEEIIFWNKGAQKMYGWSEEEAKGKTTSELLQTVFPIPLQELKAIIERMGHWQGELRQTCRDGKQIAVHCQKALIRDANEKRWTMLKINHDITDLKRAEEAFKAADRRKNEFIATLAHELRNPLVPIRNALEILRQAGGNSEQCGYASDIIERQMRQMIRIVDDLLDMSRIECGKIELHREKTALSAVVGTALETMNSLIKAHNHQLIVQLPEKPVYLYADPARLVQVLINLLHNATKFTQAGGHIWLVAELSGDANAPADGVLIRVRDDGMGISVDLMPHIFEMFAQGPRSMERVPSGLGVGLMLVKTFVQLHGGKVEVHSGGPGQGSEFVVWLPVWREQGGGQKNETGKTTMPQLRVLIADDNADAAESMETLLKSLGHETNIVHDGAELLGAVQSFKPNAALIRADLPDMDAYELARRIRSQPDLKNVLLVGLTELDVDSARYRSREAGFDYCLLRPVSMNSLQQVLAECGN